MKLQIDRQEMLEAFATVASVVPSRTPKPVLECVLVACEQGRLELAATDLEVAVRSALERFEVEGGPGRLLLPASRTLSILRELTAERVELELEQGVVTLRAGGDVFRMVVPEAEDYPSVETSGEPAQGEIAVPAGALAAMLRRSLIAVATDSTHYAMNGVLFELDPERLRLVATDGKRLALCEQPLAEGDAARFSRVVPSKGAQLLYRLAAREQAEPVRLQPGGVRLSGRHGGTQLTTQLIEGQFPPYVQVIPAASRRRVELGRQALLGALRRAALLAEREASAVRLSFGQGSLRLSARTPEVGESHIELPVAWEDEPLEVGFNPAFLIDALKVMESERVELELGEQAQSEPAVLREPGGAFLYVVMPMELD
ncbi:MAG: DNA polymerase III subunit beta [Planctomycetota bacterium]|nr:MAG: DNA polymerase III subunit beta [Planctomycetota bacterium]